MSADPSRNTAPALFPRPVLVGGLVAGSLDLAYAFTVWGLKGVPPLRILHAIASGWVGLADAVAGGAMTGLLGLVSHYGIVLAMAWTYYALARWQWQALARHPWGMGALYGLLLYGVMTYLVVPLSAAGDGGVPAWRWIHLREIAVHMFLVGVPCALAARHALRALRTHS